MKTKMFLLINAIYFMLISPSILAYPIQVKIDQQSSHKIHLKAIDSNDDDVSLDLHPHSGEYTFKSNSVYFQGTGLNVINDEEDSTSMEDNANFRIFFNYFLKLVVGDDNLFGKDGVANGYLSENVSYQLTRESTWANLLYLDDTVYINILLQDTDLHGNALKYGIPINRTQSIDLDEKTKQDF